MFNFSDSFFKKVEKKTKVNKETILELANKLQNGNMKDETTLKEVIGTLSQMGSTWQTWVGIFGLQIIIPGILVYIIDAIFRKYNLIKPGDLTI